LASKRRDLTPLFGAAIFNCEKMLWRWVHTFISVSPSIIDWYSKNIGEKESVLILNSPQVEQGGGGHNGNKYFHKVFDIPSGVKVFIYIGILDTGRGVEACLEAFNSELNQNHIVFLGTGRLENKIREYSNKSKRIHLHAPVIHSDVVNIIKSADYGLCFIENISLSDYYCLPNKLFEYAFAGLPVLASNFPEIKRVVDQYNLGLTCEPNPQAIVDAVNRASNNNFLTEPVDISELSWATQAERLTARYKKILSQTSTALPNK
jgi:glycosyltransferase involved in cell wall biosynthesis